MPGDLEPAAAHGHPGPAGARSSRLDPWIDSYAARTRGLTASQVRALFAVASRPEVVSLAGGMPYVAALPMQALSEIAARVVRDRGTVALQYGSGQGDPRLREQILEVMSHVGVRAHPDDVVVTGGSQLALDLVVRVFCDPGDVVLVEAPTYVTALGVFSSYQCEVVHVAMDEQGLDPQALREAMASCRAQGKRVKLVYTIPSFHNPAGVTQGAQRRAEVLEVARSAGLLVLEDDPYGLLGFDGSVPRALRADDAEGVVHLGTFSKTIASGLRVGWAVAPHGVREKLVLANETATLCPSNYAQLTISEYLATQPWLDQVRTYRDVYRERRDALLESLSAPDARRHDVDRPRRRVLLLGHAAERPRRHRDAAAGSCRARRVRTGHRVLRRRAGSRPASAVLLLPRARPDPGGRTTPRGGRGDRARADGHLRQHPDEPASDRAVVPVAGPCLMRRPQPPRPPDEPRGVEPMSAVVVLAGGLSAEREVSLHSGRRVVDALRDSGADASLLDVDGSLLAALAAERPDTVVLMLHGAPGEDGALRDVLDSLGVAYVGARPGPCRLAFDKPVASSLVAAAGVACPDSVTLAHATFRELGAAPVLQAVVSRLGLPLMVKPTRGGSSLGATVVRHEAELPAAMVSAFAYCETALLERFVVGTEVAVAVLDDGTGARALPVVEIRPDGGWYDYTARYTAGCDRVRRAGRPAARGPAGLRAGRGHRARHPRAVPLVTGGPGRRRDRSPVVPRGQRRARDDRHLDVPAGPRRRRPRPRRGRARPDPRRRRCLAPPVTGAAPAIPDDGWVAHRSAELPRPRFDSDDARRLLARSYGIDGLGLTELGSQQDRNFRLEHDGGRLVLKVANSGWPPSALTAQDDILRLLAGRLPGLAVPVPVAEPTSVSIDGAEHAVRLLTYVEGRPLARWDHLAAPVVAQLGDAAAAMALELRGVTHPGLERWLQWDLRRAPEVVAELLPRVQDRDLRGRVERATAAAWERVSTVADQLPLQAIHGDLTDDNLVATAGPDGRPVITGVIDFGDLAYGWRVAELVVGLITVLHHADAGPASVLPAVRAFHERVRLDDAEIAALWPLVVLRGAVLVVSGHSQITIDPENAYAASGSIGERAMFEAATSVPHEVMHQLVRSALGLPGATRTPPTSVVPMTDAVPLVVDLSPTSALLDAGRWTASDVEQQLVAAGDAVLRHGEPRLSRTPPLSLTEPETVAVGCTLVTREPLELRAPWDVTVSDSDGVLRLAGPGGTVLVRGAEPGRGELAAAGDVVARAPAGAAVHLQLVLDPDLVPPPFTTASLAPGWLGVCADPSELLGMAAGSAAYDRGRTPAQLMTQRRAVIAEVQEQYYGDVRRGSSAAGAT